MYPAIPMPMYGQPQMGCQFVLPNMRANEDSNYALANRMHNGENF